MRFEFLKRFLPQRPIRSTRRPKARKSSRLLLEKLEDRVVPAQFSLLGTSGSLALDNAIVQSTTIAPAGTGVLNSFLRIEQQGGGSSEQGYNTDYRGHPPSSNLMDAKTDPNFTRAIQLGDIGVVTIDGITYAQFILDLNEPGKKGSDNAQILLNQLQLFVDTAGTDHVTDNTIGTLTGTSNLTKVFDLNGNSILLDDHASGSGAADYLVDINTNVFQGFGGSAYVYLYSQFGSADGSQPGGTAGGFEEWAAAPAHTALTLTPTITTSIDAYSFTDPTTELQGVTQVFAGSTVHDGATFILGPNDPLPTGTITYTFFNNGNALGTPVAEATVTIVNGVVPESDTVLSGLEGPLNAGEYSFMAFYSGDANYSAGHSPLEPLTVNKLDPSLVTSAGGNLTLGTTSPTLTDSADLEGAYNATGTITFTLTFNNTVVDTETVTVNGNGVYTVPTGYTLPTSGGVTGTYQWLASYSGDTNNNGAVDQGGAAEQQVVDPANPTLTSQAGGNLTLGTTSPTLTDSADLEGAYNATGTITFTLTLNNTVVDTETVTVNGNGVYTVPTGYTLPMSGGVTGTYQWLASYSGDTNNNGAVDQGGAAEQQVVDPASPTLVSQAGGNLTLGTTSPTLTDSADLEGAYNATGTITFTLTLNNTVVDTETVTVNGNGVYTVPTGYTLPTSGAVTGTYQWLATYSGDANNNGAADQGGAAEQQVVNPAAPNLVTAAGGTMTVGTGTYMTDSATLSGGYRETGTITFTLYAPNGASVYSSSVAVSGNGTYQVKGYLAPNSAPPGTYQWVATYSGDANNLLARDQGGAAEQESLIGYSTGTPKTIGFWGNNNGKAVLQAHDPAWRTLINSLHLRNANGTLFTVSTTASFASAFSAFDSWLQGANATNMAYMLSAQLAAMELNVAFEGVSASTLLYVGPGSAINTWSNDGQTSHLMSNLNTGAGAYGLTGTNSAGFISLSTLMNDAVTMLSNYGTTTSSNGARLFEESLKIVLDAANNNLAIFAS
jgi:hypothetical protein